MAFVQVVTSGKTRDSFRNACVRNIWLVTASYDIDLQIGQFEGSKNTIAITLSRISHRKAFLRICYTT